MSTNFARSARLEMNYNDRSTENGMASHSTSGSSLLDFFNIAGASREMTVEAIIESFENAFSEKPLNAMKLLFYARDVRGGLRERRIFRECFNWLADNHSSVAVSNFDNVVKFGRWDDLLWAFGTRSEQYAIIYWINAIRHGNQLAVKWLPRENKANHESAVIFMEYLGLRPSEYRDFIKAYKDSLTVEDLMTSKRWDEIIYSHVPGVAMKKYRKAFGKNDKERFTQYILDLKSGKKGVKINTSILYPYDVVREYMNECDFHLGGMELNGFKFSKSEELEVMWNSILNKLSISDEMGDTLVMPDLSGSMFGDSNPILTSVAMAVMFAQKNTGAMKGLALGFSGEPTWLDLKYQTLYQNLNVISKADVGYNTNIAKAFELILKVAIENELKQEDLPARLLIVSDMGFDQIRASENILMGVTRMFRDAGYVAPQLVLWNVEGSSNGVAMKAYESGGTLVSGQTLDALKYVTTGVLKADTAMTQVLENERYSSVVLD